ncbi:MAG: hypothetical protein JO235_08635 [Chroococcidiopsidaceae cyanobacterium CP_BM_RX_35]|nr:hypothetical protein [Chroococcidiopsidaceae cyanobacterium CP_BM_RX_35]
MLKKLDIIINKMPPSEFIKVPTSSRMATTFIANQPVALTASWQWILAKISEALIVSDSKGVFKLLFSDLDYVKLNYNAVEDIRSLVRQSVDENALSTTQAKIALLREFMSEYLIYPQTTRSRLNRIINEVNFIIENLKSLEVVGVGAFMLASGFHLALLQEKASSDRTEWSHVKHLATEYSQYAASVTPRLFRLSVGRIDKVCQCIKWEPESEGAEGSTKYECRYSDGKDIHLFQAISPDAAIECNKHRLEMFQTVVNRVNQTAAQPVRTALKQWRNMATSI